MWDWFKAEKHVNQNVQIFEEAFVLGSPSKKVKNLRVWLSKHNRI